MKLLFDQNLSFKLVRLLADVFPDSAHVRLLGLEQADDSAIWQYAQINGYAIVSRDADFAEMSAHCGAPPRVIWMRTENQSTQSIAELLRAYADVIRASEQESGANCLELY